METIILHNPILETILRNVTNSATFLSFMMVNKRFMKVAKHILSQTPALYIADISYDTNAGSAILPPESVVYNSLKDLYINLSKIKKYDDNGNIIKSYMGACDECLLEGYDYCGCSDIYYDGIIIVKYFHCKPPTVRLQYHCRYIVDIVDNPTSGFLLRKKLCKPSSIVDEFSLNKPQFKPDKDLIDISRINPKHIYHVNKIYNINVDYRSMNYLYIGMPKHNILRKLGLKCIWIGSHDMYYPATTDTLHLRNMSIYTIEKYNNKSNSYVSFNKYNDGKIYSSLENYFHSDYYDKEYRINDI